MSTRFIFATLVSATLLSTCSSPPDVRQDQCHPCIVSVKVGPLLKDAQTMAQAGDWKGASGKLDEAEAVKSSADDEKVIQQMRRYIAVASRRSSQP